jgi:coenzyme F420-reducing hydrogenase beta subunit
MDNLKLINFKDFSITELRKMLKEDSDIEIINYSEFDIKARYTISEHLELYVSKGSENLYFDLTVYKNDNEEAYTLNLFTKEQHEILKNLIIHVLSENTNNLF